jgi:hypothetical protein
MAICLQMRICMGSHITLPVRMPGFFSVFNASPFLQNDAVHMVNAICASDCTSKPELLHFFCPAQ